MGICIWVAIERCAGIWIPGSCRVRPFNTMRWREYIHRYRSPITRPAKVRVCSLKNNVHAAWRVTASGGRCKTDLEWMLNLNNISYQVDFHRDHCHFEAPNLMAGRHGPSQ